MKKARKILLWGVGVCAALAILAVAAVIFYVDKITKAAIEKGGTYALGVETRLDSARLRLFAGQLTIGNLQVTNPNGFRADHFLTLRKGEFAVTLRSLRNETIEIPLLLLEGIDVTLERTLNGKTNYKVVLDNLERALGPSGGTKYMIHQIIIKDVTAHVNVIPLTGAITTATVKIPEIRLDNYGSETKNGVVISQLMGLLVKSILVEVARSGKGIIPNDIMGDLVKIPFKILGTTGKEAEKIIEGVGGLLKKK